MFFYGTLAHLPLLEIVLGRGLAADTVLPASLADHRVFAIEGVDYPMIRSQKSAQAKGILVTGLGAQDIARLDFYEGGFDYDQRPVQVETAAGSQVAEVYFPTKPDAPGDRPWQLADWSAKWADLALLAASESMEYFGRISAGQLAARFAAIRRRADSQLRGRSGAGGGTIGTGLTRDDVSVGKQSIAYSSFFMMQEYALRFRKFDGTISDSLERAVFTGFDVALVLPYDPLRDAVLLVEQFRLGPFARGAQHPWVLEPIAGHIDVGETPEMAARRETVEEAGLELHSLLPIANAYPSPGCSTEYYHIFLGLCDLGEQGGTTSGLASEHEDIRSHILGYQGLMKYVDSFEANNQPLILAAYWLARNRDRLRAGA